MLKKINSLYINFYRSVLILLLLGLSFMSCNNTSNQKYIISKEDSLFKVQHTRPDGIILVPPAIKFGRYNFIIDSIGQVYFYSFQEPKIIRGTFDDVENQSIVPKPNQVFKLPKELEQLFFKENVILQKTSEKIKTVTIASFKDTVEGNFIRLVKKIQIKDSSIHLNIRLATPIERKLIEYKQQGRYYP